MRPTISLGRTRLRDTTLHHIKTPHVTPPTNTNKLHPAAEIVLVALVACTTIAVGWWAVGDGLLARQLVVWVANVAMLLVIWGGLRLRGETCWHVGLAFGWPGWRHAFVNVLKSLLVFVVAIFAFALGSLCVPLLGTGPTQADMSSYDWLRGNLPMLLLALAGVYVASSFGEEVIYRGFLVNRFAEIGGGKPSANVMAVVASAVIFGLIHFGWGVVGIIQTTCMGLALAICYLALKRRLWPLVLAHCYLDTLLLVQVYLSPPATSAAP